jgi:hypothetical protein
VGVRYPDSRAALEKSERRRLVRLVSLHRGGRLVPLSWSSAGWSFVGQRGREIFEESEALSFQPADLLAVAFLYSELSAHGAGQRQYRQDTERLRIFGMSLSVCGYRQLSGRLNQFASQG